eukprot:GFYU01034148.1.p1 GENE.GFYU01034148.1~~GFYU01034148.1.p1  ORF type:complete len:140 (-),score=6.80 GFYU01034148.1:46-465(-)
MSSKDTPAEPTKESPAASTSAGATAANAENDAPAPVKSPARPKKQPCQGKDTHLENLSTCVCSWKMKVVAGPCGYCKLCHLMIGGGCSEKTHVRDKEGKWLAKLIVERGDGDKEEVIAWASASPTLKSLLPAKYRSKGK